MDSRDAGPADRKQELRQQLIGVRRSRSTADRAVATAANAAHLTGLLTGATVICAYLPLRTEPMSADLLDHLVAAGGSVLVPVVNPDSALDWCEHPGSTVPGAFGIAEPTGPRLGAASVLDADAIVVPALAVDRAGHRLGRGGGHYDRTLALLGSRRPILVAVLFDGELLEHIPAQTHDFPLGRVVTPTGGIQRLPS